MLYSASFRAKHVPSQSLDIYLIAIGGSGMAPLACLLKQVGHRVRGSDGPLYPPMSTLLADAGITPLVGFDPAHLEPRPDLVIVGNAVPRSNPEAVETERLGLAKLSMPEALADFLLDDRRSLVVAGTHGKTTTTSLAAWVWSACGTDPGYLIGGIPVNIGSNFRQGSGERFIIEGDEYNAAYFDRGPKFLHYRAETLILTSVEYDHADLYPDEASLLAAYEKLVDGLPEHGLLVACGDSHKVRRVAAGARCRTVLYGLGSHNDLHPEGEILASPVGLRFAVEDDGELVTLELPLHGDHNLTNALAVWAAARADGLPAERVAAALATFRGVRRRAEEVGSADAVTILDDFAHHPTAVATTLRGLRSRFPGRRLCVAYEPRSMTSARNIFFHEYAQALGNADLVYLAPIHYADRFAPDERLDLDGLTAALRRAGTPANRAADTDQLLGMLVADLEPGDVVVAMSSGSFNDLPRRLLGALATRQAGAGA
jgi:UDP-N-acetylmuramate: L-alanyl-gamma-D-glutamyl-meso-diaminopimelate ligase